MKISNTYTRRITLWLMCLWSLGSFAQMGVQELGDSLTAYTGFSRIWSPIVRVKQLRVNGNDVTLRTNATLKDVRWTPQTINEIKNKVSLWVLGHDKGNITIYSGKQTIDELVTECARMEAENKSPATGDKSHDLTEHNIALWPSHGLFFNKARQEWIWQRATLWTTVEDLYSQEYMRLLRQMLENAGATLYMPRPGLEQNAIGPSGLPKWCQGARYWLMEQGADTTIWDLYEGDEYKDDMKCRAMWVNSLDVPIDLCLALHTDGLDSENDSTIIGTLCIYTAQDDDNNTTLRDGRNREKVNRNAADWIQTQIVNDLRTIAPEWTRRQLKEANYCESRVPVVPGVLVELLSHKNMADMKYGLDPHFRFVAARALYKGILRYINGYNAVVQPLPVQQLAINADGLLQWQPSIDPIEPTAKPSYYMVYIQENDGEWDVQQVEKATQLQTTLKKGVRYNYYVVAGNDGGLSLPSPTISAYLNDQSPILIVDAFDDVYGPQWFADSTYAGIVPGSYACEDHFSCAYIGQQWDFTRSHPWINDDNCGWGACYRDHAGLLTMGNTHDYAAMHGRELQKMQLSYVSCTAGMLTNHLMVSQSNGETIDGRGTHHQLIDFICGRNRQPLTKDAQQVLTSYVKQGGKLLISGDHWQNIDASWLKQTLHATFYASNATRSGRIISPQHRPYQLRLEPNEEQLFTCTPEGLKPVGDEAFPWATYQDMRCPAAVGAINHQSPTTNHQSIIYGFPLEAVSDFDRIYRHAIRWLTSPSE